MPTRSGVDFANVDPTSFVSLSLESLSLESPLPSPSAIMPNQDTSSATSTPVTPLQHLPHIHSIQPVPTIRRFDGTRPNELAAILDECEIAVMNIYPTIQKDSPEFYEKCLYNVVQRLDLTRPEVYSSYQIWASGKAPSWPSLRLQLEQHFLTPFNMAGQAYTFITSSAPSGTDRTALLEHVSRLNEPFRVLAEQVKKHPVLRSMWDFENLHIIRNFFFTGSLLKAAPPQHHCSLLRQLDYEDSPSLTCTKLAEAMALLVRPSIGTVAAVSAGVQPPQNAPKSSKPQQHNLRTPQSFTPRQQSTQSNDKSVSWVPAPNTCYNCGESDHLAMACPYKPYCWYHKMEGHSWRKCKAYPDALKATLAVLAARRGNRDFPQDPPRRTRK